MNDLVTGAYYSYTPISGVNREGVLLVGKKYPRYLDTYWDETGYSASANWQFSNAEIESAKLLFDPSEDWIRVGRYAISLPQGGSFEDYDPNDIRYIPSQHGKIKVYWVRAGAKPSDEIKTLNLMKEVEKASKELNDSIAKLETAVINLKNFKESLVTS